MMRKKQLLCAAIITMILAAGDLFAFPLGMFLEIRVADVEPIFFSLMINQWLLITAALLILPHVCPTLDLHLTKTGFASGIKRYGWSCLIMFVVALAAFFVGFIGRYDYIPTVIKVLIEGIVYYIGVGVIEELYIRGLLLNTIETLCAKQAHADVIAIVTSSLIFALGHIPGMLGQDSLTICCRLLWTFAMGIYLGTVYRSTENLWVPILFHAVIDFATVPFCFTTLRSYPVGALVIIAACFSLVGGMCFWSYIKKKA